MSHWPSSFTCFNQPSITKEQTLLSVHLLEKERFFFFFISKILETWCFFIFMDVERKNAFGVGKVLSHRQPLERRRHSGWSHQVTEREFTQKAWANLSKIECVCCLIWRNAQRTASVKQVLRHRDRYGVKNVYQNKASPLKETTRIEMVATGTIVW